jgi:DNA-binding MarR family transcriptional regulator
MSDRPALPDAVTRSLDSLRRIFRALRISARRAERELGLSGAQLFVLQQLDEQAARSLNDLAERTRTHQSSVSVVVRRLVERGLVDRAKAPEDTRRIRLRLTARGRALLRRSRPAGQLQLIQAIASLPATKRRVLAQTLEYLVDNMRLRSSPADMMFVEVEGSARERVPDGGSETRGSVDIVRSI